MLDSLDRHIDYYLYKGVQEHFQPVHIFIFSMCTYNSTFGYTESVYTKAVYEHQYFQIN
jgi:hypothetical protein